MLSPISIPSAAFAFALALSCALPAPALVVTIKPVADTCLFELDPDNNWGAQTEIVAGSIRTGERARGLFAFDIADAVPAGSTITAARLKLRVVRTPPGPANTDFQLLRILAPWEEGSKSGEAGSGSAGGSAASAGETTWRSRAHGGTLWSQPGGAIEFEFAEDPSALQFVGGNGDKIFDFNLNGISDVQSMLTAPADNFGWALVSTNETASKSARRWASREHPTDPPELEITFTPPPAPGVPEILDFQIDPDSGTLTVDVGGKAGTTYRLETSLSLAPGGWTAVDSATPSADASLALTGTFTPGTKRLFFRVSASSNG